MQNRLEVRTSLGLAFTGRSLRPTDGPSVRRNGLPDRQNIGRCVVVPVVVHTASGAYPVLDAKHNGAVDVAAGRAHLATRKPAVYLHDLAPIALGFGLQQSGDCPDSGVRHAAREAVVFDHPAQVQNMLAAVIKQTAGNKLTANEVLALVPQDWRELTGKFAHGHIANWCAKQHAIAATYVPHEGGGFHFSYQAVEQGALTC
jgi:hypothetical protein